MENTETWEEDEGVKTKSVDEFEQKLKDAFCDECNGVIEYNNLAKEAAENFLILVMIKYLKILQGKKTFIRIILNQS